MVTGGYDSTHSRNTLGVTEAFDIDTQTWSKCESEYLFLQHYLCLTIITLIVPDGPRVEYSQGIVTSGGKLSFAGGQLR